MIKAFDFHWPRFFNMPIVYSYQSPEINRLFFPIIGIHAALRSMMLLIAKTMAEGTWLKAWTRIRTHSSIRFGYEVGIVSWLDINLELLHGNIRLSIILVLLLVQGLVKSKNVMRWLVTIRLSDFAFLMLLHVIIEMSLSWKRLQTPRYVTVVRLFSCMDS